MNSLRFRWLTLLTCCVLTCGLIQANPTLAQQPPEGMSDQDLAAYLSQRRIKPQTEEFKKATEALREHLRKMRELIVRYNVTDDTTQAREIRRTYLEEIQPGNELHHAMISAAVKEFQSNPAENPLIGEMLVRLIERKIDVDRFEGLLEAELALVGTEFETEDLARQITMTSIALNEYDKTEKFVAPLVQDPVQGPRFKNIQDDLRKFRENWERELELREQDAAGEPLPMVRILTTKGAMDVELFENQAPQTVANFIHLVERGYYDGLNFHRVVEHFAAQGGCPNGDGSGDDGYTIYGENDNPDSRSFFRGTLGMALAGTDTDSAGTQFFITFLPTPELHEQGFTGFGRVVEGLEVLGNLNKIDPDAEGDKKEEQKGLMPDEIIEITVLRKREHEYVPTKVK